VLDRQGVATDGTHGTNETNGNHFIFGITRRRNLWLCGMVRNQFFNA